MNFESTEQPMPKRSAAPTVAEQGVEARLETVERHCASTLSLMGSLVGIEHDLLVRLSVEIHIESERWLLRLARALLADREAARETGQAYYDLTNRLMDELLAAGSARGSDRQEECWGVVRATAVTLEEADTAFAAVLARLSGPVGVE